MERRIGRYTLLEPLGEGGMARVFIAQKDGSPEICVLKRLHGQLESNALASKRFLREAHIASLLSHRAIARVLDAGIEDSSFCIAMELIAGQTLEAIVDALNKEGRTLPLPLALFVAAEVLGALQYAHDFADEEGRPLKIVHRDLTPRNIMVSYSGVVKIIDFGIARGDVDELKTAPGVLMGTPYYMSPEQARTLPVDRRSDLYTFAAVLFEMFAGRRLVRAKGRAAILAAVAVEEAPLISTVNARVPAAFDPVLARALDKDPAARHANANELLEDLLRAAGGVKPATVAEAGALLRELFPEGQAKAAERAARSGDHPPAETTRVERPFDSNASSAPRPPPPRQSSQRWLAVAALIVFPAAIALLYFAREGEPEVLQTKALEIASVEVPKVVAKTAVAEEAEPPPPVEEPPRKTRPQKKPAAEVEAPPAIETPPPPPSRTAELERMLASLRAAPKDTKLRTQLYDRLAAESEKLPAAKQRRIKAAIDRALLDEDISGLELGVAEIKKAIDANEMR